MSAMALNGPQMRTVRRLDRVMAYLGCRNQSELSRMLGISQTSISLVKLTGKMGLALAEAICRAIPDITLDWLLRDGDPRGMTKALLDQLEDRPPGKGTTEGPSLPHKRLSTHS